MSWKKVKKLEKQERKHRQYSDEKDRDDATQIKDEVNEVDFDDVNGIFQPRFNSTMNHRNHNNFGSQGNYNNSRNGSFNQNRYTPISNTLRRKKTEKENYRVTLRFNHLNRPPVRAPEVPERSENVSSPTRPTCLLMTTMVMNHPMMTSSTQISSPRKRMTMTMTIDGGNDD